MGAGGEPGTATLATHATDEPPSAPLGVEAGTKVNYYQDNDGNQVIAPVTEVRANLTENLQVGAHVALDIMTCASVDVVSAATPKGYFQETREEYGADASVRLGLVTVSAAGVFSRENDYSSMTGSLSVSTELAQRNTTLSLGYGFTDSNVGRANDSTFNRDLDSHAVTLTVTQVLSPSLVAQLSYFFGALNGFQSSSYRTVQIADGTRTEERAPDARYRHAGVVRLKYAAGKSWFIAGDYRFYGDTWGVKSHTIEASVTHEVNHWFAVRLRDRLYLQSKADFYSGTYDRRRAFMTSDRELGGLWSNLVGLKMTFTPKIHRNIGLTFDAKVDYMLQQFDDFDALPQRHMLMVEAGAKLTF